MVKYILKNDYSQSSLKMVHFLTKVEESRLKINENNIIKNIMFFFEFIMRQLQKLKNFGTIKIDNKYV
jgi:hypothetical protein